MTLDEIVKSLDLKKLRRSGNGYTACCPAHDDHRPSLSIFVGDDGNPGNPRVHFKCYRGCDERAILNALGLEFRDLYLNERPSEEKQRKAIYHYTDAQGKEIARKVRKPGKKFIWLHPDEKGGFINGTGGAKIPLYRLPEVMAASVVYLVEGEKDADNLRRLGKVATTTPNGAGSKWQDSYTDTLKGKSVIIIADNDEPGRKHAKDAADKLKNEALSVNVIDLTQIWPELPEHGDTSDILTHFGDAEGLKRIEALAKTTVTEKPTIIKPRIVKASDVPYEPPRWLLPPYFQRGKGTLIQADNGMGKTAFMCAIAAHISTGNPILGIEVKTPGNVLMLSVEDDLPILRGRVEANGGDLSKCNFMTNAAGLSFNSPEIEQAVIETKAKLLIFDPLQAFMGAKVDMFRANETRPELAKLFAMCDRHDCACAIIAHMSKNTFGKAAVNSALGSVDIPASMRSILQLVRDPGTDECVAIHVKSSNAPKGKSLAFKIGDRGAVIWSGFSDLTEADIASINSRAEKGIPYEQEPLVQVFNQLVADNPGGGFWSYADFKSEGAKILGFPPYSGLNDLRNKLDNGLARELQQREGLIISHGAKGPHNIRGIRIEQYSVPKGYQMSMGV